MTQWPFRTLSRSVFKAQREIDLKKNRCSLTRRSSGHEEECKNYSNPFNRFCIACRWHRAAKVAIRTMCLIPIVGELLRKKINALWLCYGWQVLICFSQWLLATVVAFLFDVALIHAVSYLGRNIVDSFAIGAALIKTIPSPATLSLDCVCMNYTRYLAFIVVRMIGRPLRALLAMAIYCPPRSIKSVIELLHLLSFRDWVLEWLVSSRIHFYPACVVNGQC